MSMIDDAHNRAKLEADAKRRGLTPNALEMSRAVGTDLIGDIVRDHIGKVSPVAHRPVEPAPARGNGWVDPPAVSNWKPPGLAVMDRMMDVQDALDRAERTRRYNRLPLNGGD
jgi:hypothetical protein